MWNLPLPKNFRQFLQPGRRLAIAEACLIGLVAALSAVFLKYSVGWLGTWRVYFSYQLPAWFLLPAVGLSFGVLAGWIVELFGTEASGSGIPQVKAALASFPIALDLRVALVKLTSCTFALASGITLGRQGPTVHIGAALAAQLSRWVPTSPNHRRQMIAAGAGAGLAAAFNAPLAGVLFVVEELLHDVSGFTLGTAIIASFIGAVVSRLLGGHTLDLHLELQQLHSTFSMPEIPFYLLLGILAGLLVGLFYNGIFVSLNFYKRTLRLGLPLRIGLAGMISGIAIANLPDFFRDNTGLRQFLLAGEASWKFALVAFIAQFILTLVAFGSGAPGGLFAPSLILGSSLGYLVGLLQAHFLHLSDPTTYALAGMGAFFSGVSKVPITAIVIVFEMTTDFNLVLPLMIGSVTSYLVAEKVAPRSIYDRLLEWNGIKLEPETPTHGVLAKLTAADLMQQQVETLKSEITLEQAFQAFSRSRHRGFPVVDNGKLVGIVTQSDLDKRHLPGSASLREVMTTHPITVNPTDSLTDVLYLLNRYQLSRLPVTEGRRLVGIITRTDLIRAEAKHLTASTEVGRRPQPSYVVYQTRSPAVGQGRLLVPLANPQTAPALLQLAAAIARDRNYELVCLQVILAPRHSTPSETPVKTTKSRRLLRLAEHLAAREKISIHTQIRVAHDVTQAILETIKEQHINLILMGWNAEPPTTGRIFGSIVDNLIKNATCELVLVKLAAEQTNITSSSTFNPKSKIQNPKFTRWLIPVAGGPNSQQALELLPALVTLSNEATPVIELCQVFHSGVLMPDTSILEKSAYYLSSKLHTTVTAIPIRSNSVSDALINLAEAAKFDVVVLGASREGLLQQVITGNIPEAIARSVNSTVILVRTALKSS